MNSTQFSIEPYIPKKNILDVRTLLVLNIGLSVLMFYGSNLVAAAAFCISFGVMLLFGLHKSAAKYAFAFVLCRLFILLPVVFLRLRGSLSVIGFLAFGALRCIPLIMIAHTVIKKVDSGVLVCALKKLGLHKGFVLALTVALRFLPTARQEMTLIKECMKMRGIEAGFKNFCKNPSLIIEYSLVPLLFRSVKISEEMTAAALVKGTEYPGKKTSLTDVRLTLIDAVFLLAALCVMTASVMYEPYLETHIHRLFAGIFGHGGSL